MSSFFDNYGFVSCGIFNVTPHEAFELCSKGAVIVDVREVYLNNFKNFSVPEILFLPKSRLEKEFLELPQDKYLIFADTVGLRSKEVVTFLKEKGFEKIANMAGGIVDWERDGLPVKTDTASRLSGSCMCQLKPNPAKREQKLKIRQINFTLKSPKLILIAILLVSSQLLFGQQSKNPWEKWNFLIGEWVGG